MIPKPTETMRMGVAYRWCKTEGAKQTNSTESVAQNQDLVTSSPEMTVPLRPACSK
jgi:hypothetical protein